MLYIIKENSTGLFVAETHGEDLKHNTRWVELDPYRKKIFTKEQAKLLLETIKEEDTRQYDVCELQFKEISRYSIDIGKKKCVRNPCLRYILLNPKTDKYIGEGLKEQKNLYDAKLFATPRTARDFIEKSGAIEENQHLLVLQMGLTTEKETAAS